MSLSPNSYWICISWCKGQYCLPIGKYLNLTIIIQNNLHSFLVQGQVLGHFPAYEKRRHSVHIVNIKLCLFQMKNTEFLHNSPLFCPGFYLMTSFAIFPKKKKKNFLKKKLIQIDACARTLSRVESHSITDIIMYMRITIH